ncbi:MAG: hypothetical protein KY457_11325 [Actinobacteria bacterium]|nr:hypothetical protein [Actinomycetota bacterium]
MATNLRLRDVHEGDLVEVDGRHAHVSCALVLDDDVFIVLDDGHGNETTLSGGGAIKLIARQLADTIAGPSSSIVAPA